MVSKLIRLLARGDRVSIQRGRLCIIPASGKDVPEYWLRKNERQMIVAILQKMNMDALIFIDFNKGQFEQKYRGVHLQFESLLAANSHYCIFNAEVHYCRGKNAGKILPRKQFRVLPRSKFIKFWKRTGLELPPRLSSFHDYMGNLKNLLFFARLAEKEKLEKDTLSPLSMSYKRIQAAFVDELTNSSQTSARQFPDDFQTKEPYNELLQIEAHQGLGALQTTGDLNHGIRLKGDAVIRDREHYMSQQPKKRPEDQTEEEWLADLNGDENLYFPNDLG